MDKHLDWLGWKVRDKVTGFTGVVSHIGIDLYGCVQGTVTPETVVEKNGLQKMEDSRWFDLTRLDKVGKKRVMEPVPIKGDLSVAGCFDKPAK
jgi:hypothetical protein